MPNDGTNLLEVPGNRLPETGSRQIKKFCILELPGNRLPNTGSNMAELKKKQQPGNRFYARNDQPGRMKYSSIVKLY
ncbi:hypothetical protein V6N12_034425 [Hibiscus sabdariffa]|uniref:Uncharacterized protein n=1 Tax=Hibiscus sabdariffa TaxID=183260 RepID=A0ABR2DK21_9ROSI